MGLIDKILDLTVVYSFDHSGFVRHVGSPEYSEMELDGKNILITGGSSGIGLACADLCHDCGAIVHITGRNKDKGEKATQSKERMNFLAFDLADWKELNQLCQKINEPLDGIVLNAGGMPESFLTNEFGVELQMASQLFGHYFLIRKLKELGKLTKGARIVWVSSGGMYLTRLQKDYIFKNKDYNKVSTYANVKKAQVALLNTIKEEFSDQVLVGMHPGWVETPGLKASISDFYQKMANRLRSPAEGADTIVWLLGRNKAPVAGEFYFDRRPARKDLFFNKVKQSDRDFFMELLNKYYEELN